MTETIAEIQEIDSALRRRLSWAETCTYASMTGSTPRELRRILGGLPVARRVEERIDRAGRAAPALKGRVRRTAARGLSKRELI